MIEITINGTKLNVEPKTTILRAALDNGIKIPNMCWDRRLTPYGGCRLCLVEVEGQRKLLAACSTPAENGMVVHTETPTIDKARRTVLELLLIHHPLDCPVCDKAGECALQDLAFKYGPAESRFRAERKHDPESTAAPLVERNQNRCILCGKCVRVCAEHQGVGAIALLGRGFKTIVSPAFEETLNCEFDGQCIDACPVGALGSKPYRFRSRVWFMNEQDNICPYCGCGCTVTLSVRDGRIIRSKGKSGKGISRGDLCGKGRFGLDFVYSDHRLTTPLIRKDGELKPASWDEALGFAAGKLKEIKAKRGPRAIGAIGSQRCTVEDNYALKGFMSDVIGSGNIDSSARFGYAKITEAVNMAFGLSALPIKFDSPLSSDVIFVVDSDITSTHPVFGLNILKAKRMEGARLIVADPKFTKLSRHSSSWLRMRPGTAVALLNGVMKAMLDEGIYDKKAEGVSGFGPLKDSLKDYTPERVSETTGIPADEIKAAARAFAGASRPLLCLSLGESENTKGLNTALAAANLVILSGCGPEALQMPAEYSNSMGMYEVGIRPDKAKEGLDVYGMLYDGASPIKALYIMGENPVVTYPDASDVEANLKKLELLIVQDIMLTDTAKLAHVVLPAASWAEKEGTLVGSTGIAQKVVKCSSETGESRPDWKIIGDLAKSMGTDMKINSIADIGADINMKFDFDIAPSFAFNPVEQKTLETPDKDYPFTMVTGILMQHSGSLTTLSNNLGTVVSDAYIQINDRDAGSLKVSNEGYVKVTSRRGEVYLKARVTDEVPEGMLFVPAHFSHARVNALTHPASNGEAPVVAVNVQPA